MSLSILKLVDLLYTQHCKLKRAYHIDGEYVFLEIELLKQGTDCMVYIPSDTIIPIHSELNNFELQLMEDEEISNAFQQDTLEDTLEGSRVRADCSLEASNTQTNKQIHRLYTYIKPLSRLRLCILQNCRWICSINRSGDPQWYKIHNTIFKKWTTHLLPVCDLLVLLDENVAIHEQISDINTKIISKIQSDTTKSFTDLQQTLHTRNKIQNHMKILLDNCTHSKMYIKKYRHMLHKLQKYKERREITVNKTREDIKYTAQYINHIEQEIIMQIKILGTDEIKSLLEIDNILQTTVTPIDSIIEKLKDRLCFI